MPWFIKTERFTPQTLKLTSQERRLFLEKHKAWVAKLNATGIKICSGYLADQNKLPGGGGLLILEAESYEDAIALIEKDPMIMNNLVSWEIQEWIPCFGELMN